MFFVKLFVELLAFLFNIYVAVPFIPLAFVNDTPHVDSNQVTFELQFDPSLTSVTCEVVGQASVDCKYIV